MEPERNQKIVVLTGASRGIGHATVKKFASENWRVITCSRNPFDDRCPWPGGEINHIQLDLSNPNQTIEAIEEIKSNTKKYAKRQMTWFKRDKDYSWVDNNDRNLAFEEITSIINDN